MSRAEEHQLDLHLRRVAARELARAAVAAAQPRYQAKGVDLRLTIGHDAGDVDADAERMGQVLGKLLDNALRHMPAGGIAIVVGLSHGLDMQPSMPIESPGRPPADSIDNDQRES